MKKFYGFENITQSQCDKNAIERTDTNQLDNINNISQILSTLQTFSKNNITTSQKNNPRSTPQKLHDCDNCQNTQNCDYFKKNTNKTAENFLSPFEQLNFLGNNVKK